MRISHVVFSLIAGCSILFTSASAQQQNIVPVVVNPVVLKTKLELFEARTGTVIVRGTADVGSMPAKIGTISVKCEEISEPANGVRVLGLAITITQAENNANTVIVDYDELDGFLAALDYLSQANWSLTHLSSFNAAYVTRGELRLAAFSSRRGADVEASLQYTGLVKTRAQLTLAELAQLRELISRGKRTLDEIANEKPQP